MSTKLKSPNEIKQGRPLAGRPHFFKKRVLNTRIDEMRQEIGTAKIYIKEMMRAIDNDRRRIKSLEKKEVLK